MNVSANNLTTVLPGQLEDAYNSMEGLLAGFYMVKPSRTMHASIQDVPNFYNMFISMGPIMFAIEFVVLWLQSKPVYKWNDSIAGFSAFTLAAVPQAFIETFLFTFYSWIWKYYRIIDVPYDSMWTWFMCIFAFDLSMYVAHRGTHEVNLMWASHQVHHSSEYFNFFSAGRNSFTDKGWIGVCGLPWAFLLPPGPAKAHHQLNLIFQLWIHTKTIGNMGPLEYIICTPTQHALHHGRNRFCIDVNYGGVLSIWDIMFGTMVWPRDHPGKKIYYGLVHPTKSWDIAYNYSHHYRDIGRRMLEYDGVMTKLGAVVMGPGWEPGKPRLGLIEDIPEDPVDKEPYDKQSPVHIYMYCLTHLFVAFVMNNAIVSLHWLIPYHIQLIGFSYILWTIIDIGYILEHKTYAPKLEWMRCLWFFVIDWLIGGTVFTRFGSGLYVIKALCAVSAAAWVLKLDYFNDKKKFE